MLHACLKMYMYLVGTKDSLLIYNNKVLLIKTCNNNKKFRSFKSKGNIHKKEVGPYHGFGY